MPHPLLAQTAHRAAPPPPRPWVMRQVWHDLLFAHWPVPAERLAPLLPAGLALDTFDGSAWLGVVPFRMSGIRWRGTPAVPGASAFPELNVRTYATCRGEPGVWFFSLDAASLAAVAAARALWNLPYHWATMRCAEEDGWVAYRSERRGARDEGACWIGRYRPTGEVAPAAPGSLAAFLTERYALFAATKNGRIHRGDIHHLPWPLQPAEAEVETDTLLAPLGLDRPEGRPLLHFARRLETLIWPLRRVR